jgi:hypothetical protein
VYGDVFGSLTRDFSRVPKNRRLHNVESGNKFELLENDYTIGGRKIGGNAQAILKNAWLHHTSFLWDYRKDRMDLLREPKRRPQYRGERKHESFLTPLISHGYNRQEFVEMIEDAMVCQGLDTQLVGALRELTTGTCDILSGDRLRLLLMYFKHIEYSLAGIKDVEHLMEMDHIRSTKLLDPGGPELMSTDQQLAEHA